jgi:hypothetical protein
MGGDAQRDQGEVRDAQFEGFVAIGYCGAVRKSYAQPAG